MQNRNEENLRGALFHNSGKTDNSPQRKGYVIVNDEKYWISSWDKKGNSGDIYWTLQLTKATEKKDESGN